MHSIVSRTAPHFSPLRYPGGKAGLSDFLANLIETNSLNHCTYAEIYAGGAGVALNLLLLEKVDTIIINDYDRAIYSFWKSVIEESDRFVNKLERVPLTIQEWKNQKRIYCSETQDIFKLGFATFYLNRTNRSGIINAGPIGGMLQTGNWTIDARFNRKSLIERIQKIAKYRNRIEVFNKDGIGLMKKLTNRKDIFTYLDPPYFLKGSSLYLNYYDSADHEALAKILNKSLKMNWVLTYDNVPEISNLYSKRKIFEFSINYHADIAKKGQELLILSDKIKFPGTYLID